MQTCPICGEPVKKGTIWPRNRFNVTCGKEGCIQENRRLRDNERNAKKREKSQQV